MQSLSDGRIRRTQSEWRAIVGRFESRDLSEAASCHRVELSKSFRMWRARLAGDVAFQRVQATRKPRPNPFTEAARHALELRASLEVFRSDPDVPIDTNHLERALRPIPVGRKAWLFCWTEVGAEKVGIIQSLITTCVLHGVDPYTYLVDELQRVATHPQRDVADLTPRLWKEEKFTDQALPSPTLAS